MKSTKKIGRPPTGRKGRPLQLYAEDDFIAAVDEWRATQRPIPNRSVAIRRLVEQALKPSTSAQARQSDSGKGKR